MDVEAADVVGSRAGFESYHDQIYRRGDQTEAKALSRRQTDLEWLVSWAEDEARAKIPPDPKKIKALADLDRRRRSVANVRRHARDAAQTLRRSTPRASRREMSRGFSSRVLARSRRRGNCTIRSNPTSRRARRCAPPYPDSDSRNSAPRTRRRCGGRIRTRRGSTPRRKNRAEDSRRSPRSAPRARQRRGITRRTRRHVAS